MNYNIFSITPLYFDGGVILAGFHSGSGPWYYYWI